MVEHSGLTVQEAQSAIERYEVTAREAREARMKMEAAPVDAAPDSLKAVKRRILAASADGTLQAHIRSIVADNRQKAGGGKPLERHQTDFSPAGRAQRRR